MTWWDDSFLRRPAADLVDAALAREAAAGNPDAAVAAEADYADAAEAWDDAAAAWMDGLRNGWLDPEADGPDPGPGLDDPEIGV